MKRLGSQVRREFLSYLETKEVYQLANIEEMGPEMQKRFAKVMVDEGVVKEETVRRLHPKKQVAGVLISLLVLAGLGWTCTRVDMGYICGCIALVAGVLKYRNIIQFNSLTVQRFRNTYKDEMDLNKYNKYVDSHF